MYLMGDETRGGRPNFSTKGKRENILVFVGHMISAVATQLGHCHVKAATDDK